MGVSLNFFGGEWIADAARLAPKKYKALHPHLGLRPQADTMIPDLLSILPFSLSWGGS